MAVRPRSDSDQENLQRALNDFALRDPTLRIETSKEIGQIVISGIGELHLEVICDRIVREHKIQIDIGEPKVIYLYKIRKKSEAEGKYIRAISRHYTYGHVKLRLEPLEPGSGYQFVDEITDGAIPSEFLEPIKLGIQKAMDACISACLEIVDLRVVLYGGSYQPGDASEFAFQIAAAQAFKEALRKASPVILEPIMSVRVVTPEDFAGTIMNDLASRRGQVKDMQIRDGSVVIAANIPLAEMFGYANDVRSWTQGRAQYSMQFVQYEKAPRRMDSGDDVIGVTANRPKGPAPRSGRVAENPDKESA